MQSKEFHKHWLNASIISKNSITDLNEWFQAYSNKVGSVNNAYSNKVGSVSNMDSYLSNTSSFGWSTSTAMIAERPKPSKKVPFYVTTTLLKKFTHQRKKEENKEDLITDIQTLLDYFVIVEKGPDNKSFYTFNKDSFKEENQANISVRIIDEATNESDTISDCITNLLRLGAFWLELAKVDNSYKNELPVVREVKSLELSNLIAQDQEDKKLNKLVDQVLHYCWSATYQKKQLQETFERLKAIQKLQKSQQEYYTLVEEKLDQASPYTIGSTTMTPSPYTGTIWGNPATWKIIPTNTSS